ncbi:MAG: type II secretion system inner membrane protein GspF [Candidatus Hydrogenedentes bacterium]|nr:type II secretion system inner membrane protein GspF [Candidatus Hydrogenedentota bacterium]
MAVFEYQALAKTGKTVRGTIDADTPAAARRKLREQELHPTRIEATFEKSATGREERGAGLSRISQRDLALMTRQLAVLLKAGMPLVEALTALIAQTSSPRLRKIIFDVRDRVNEGVSLADAMASHQKVFSELFVNMIRAGESSGALESVLARLADITERNVRMKHKITSMLAYPVLMAFVGFGVVTFLMAFIVPKIVQIFEKQDRELPTITKVMMGTCYFIKDWWILIIAAAIGSYVLWRMWVSRPDGRLKWDKLKLRLPLLGPLYVKMTSARFARTLGTMLQSGLTMMTALDVVKTVVQNRVIEGLMDDVKSSVRRGRDLATPLQETGYFPPMLIHMIELGQRSGELESMLTQVADTYDEDIELTVNGIVSLLEPMMILVMGALVGTLVMSILLPIFEMSSGV